MKEEFIMPNGQNLEYKDDYVQSANTLFHFMKEREYLIKALNDKALKPRYCMEDIDYININDLSGNKIKEVAVLQKCFCDIPLHKLMAKFEITISSDEEILDMEKKYKYENEYNTHPGCYGTFAVGFSKSWSVSHGLQPIIYLNKSSTFLNEYRCSFEKILNSKDIDDMFVDDLIGRLSYFKPLQGNMVRKIDGKIIKFDKNFHDEKEWRYIPSNEMLEKVELQRVISKPIIKRNLEAINKNIEMSKYESIWLKFDYEDIKYIIVPSVFERDEMIKCILDMEIEKFKDVFQRNVLISKILVLDDIRKDW